MGNQVEAYFTELRDIHAMGGAVAEVSYYGALANLLNEVGRSLKPKVRAFMQLRNAGAGNPDGGLFTHNQWKLVEGTNDPLSGQIPARGAIEVKGTGDDAFAIAQSEQVARYAERYGLVLVTNLRDFVLVRWEDGEVRELESCRLASDEATFWARVATPHVFADQVAEGLSEFLRRVMLHNAPLTDPKDLAWFLASYARTARLRLEHRHELPALSQLRSQLEESLGLKFEGEKGDHFFRSTLVQTLFYGMFASWVLWARNKPREAEVPWEQRFQWETATATLHVPMVYELFRQFADVRQLGALGVAEVLEWAEEVLWRVDRTAFFEKFREDHAVQYFYEPFLEAFDPELRKELGVWYTPDEVVKYMVARVDWALREQLGIADGLADPNVVVLDPCCGTGAYLVEVLRRIDETLQAKGADALTRQDVKRAAMHRVIGFEIMPAPFVISHLNLGILLAELGVPLRDTDERAAVYLTNALTGWEASLPAPRDRRIGDGQMAATQLFPEFAEERDAANRVKREEQILVVIGNPPYNGFAGVAEDAESASVDVYKKTLASDWGIRKYNLDDLYVRFWRLAERRIAEIGGRGVACFISNFSWLGDASFVVMRKRLLDEFDSLWIDNLNGDSRETGKTTPEGLADPSVFSTKHNREGIRVGTAIGMLVRRNTPSPETCVHYRDFWGASKRAALGAAGLPDPQVAGVPAYRAFTPAADTRFSLRPRAVSAGYLRWPKLTELCKVPPINGLMEKRAGALFDIDRDDLAARMQVYFDPTADLSVVESVAPGLARNAAAFDARTVRRRALAEEDFQPERIVRYAIRPLEDRHAYYTSVPSVWNRPRPTLGSQLAPDNAFVLSRVGASTRDEGVPFYFTGALSDDHLLAPDASCFSIMVPSQPTAGLFESNALELAPNLSVRTTQYVHDVAPNAEPREAAALVWMHCLAVGFSNLYLSENSDGVKSDWPRIPLPATQPALRHSAELGQAVAQILDPLAACFLAAARREMPGDVGVISATSGSLDPATDLAVTARWGIAGKGGICMPSTGKLTERVYASDERAAIADHAAALGLPFDQAVELLGDTCFDVYLNDAAYWRCVPSNVWRYTIGGYQVMKKWLSYRERALLGRDLKPEEARYVTDMVRRIAALVLMQPELDANYERVKADVWEWNA